MLSLFTTAFACRLRPVHTLRNGAHRARSSPRRAAHPARVVQLLAGLAAVATGVSLVIRAELGVASWDILNVALASRTGASIAVVSAVVGVGAAALAWLLGRRPTWGTLLPLMIVTPALELALRLVVTPATVPGQVAMLGGGMIMLAVGVGAYVGADHGAGPADLVFLALAGRGLPVWAAKLTIDGVIGGIGLTLGGPVGVGTIAITAGMGPLIGLAIAAFDLTPARTAVEAYRVQATPETSREFAGAW